MAITATSARRKVAAAPSKAAGRSQQLDNPDPPARGALCRVHAGAYDLQRLEVQALTATKPYTIGRLARATGCKVQTIRWYEQVGLMPEPARTPGNQRVYRPEDASRLDFIRHARELGFPLEAIREMLDLADRPGQSCAAVDAIARRHLDDVTRRIERLRGLRAELERMITACRGGRVETCRIIEVLADHSHAHCLADAHDPD